MALAYIRSPFFKISLEMASVYKMIQDELRYNENILIYKNENANIEVYEAGARFHKDFILETKNIDKRLLNKIQMAVYTQNKELTPATWRSFDYEGIFTMNPFYG